jgi:glucans biosynthesis protein C
MKTKRCDYLDNIKWALTVLVILHHSACTAGLDPIGYNLPHVVKSMRWQYDILGNFLGYNQSFFMSLFFFISAYFVIPSFKRKGTRRFMLDKLKRLGIPTLMTYFIIIPVIGIFFMKVSFSFLFNYYGSMLERANFNLGVTWFCWSLIVFSGFFVLTQKYFLFSKSNPVDKKIPAIWKILVFAVVIIPFNYLGLYLTNLLGEDFLGFHLLKFFPMYIAMFYFGTLAYRYQWLDQITFKHAFWGILMWIFAKAFIGPISEGYGLNPPMMNRGFSVIGMSMFLLYAFKILFSSKSKLTDVLSRSAFAAYVIQNIPMAFFAEIYVPYMSQSPLVNFIVIAIPSVISSFFIGYVICKLPVLKRIF